MATHCIPQLSFKFDKQIVATFDAEYASADAITGALRELFFGTTALPHYPATTRRPPLRTKKRAAPREPPAMNRLFLLSPTRFELVLPA